MKLNLLSVIVAGLSLAAIPTVFAKTYQGEISATYAEIDEEDSNADINNSALEGTFYFAPVDIQHRPLAESAFLQKASNVYVRGAYDRDKDSYSFGNYHSERQITEYEREAGVEFYIPDSIFYVGAGIRDWKLKDEWRSGDEAEKDTIDWKSQWYATAGVTPVDGLLVWSNFFQDVDISDYWNINAKYVMPLGNGDQWLNLEANYGDLKDEVRVLRLSGDYYFDHYLSVGVGLSQIDEQDDDENYSEYFIRAQQFFTESVAVNLEYVDGEYESRWEVGATARF
ncbi:MAG TPA: putative porin [Cellvibrio sp.]|nr:putative porin [Cellvibrio sp.]